jgi:hypothetical protein
MELLLPGHPIHTRALSVTLTQSADAQASVTGSILDLRKRGFCPVGSELQGMGIIHHMELHGLIDTRADTVVRLEARQPTIAFEASPQTEGESCRDPMGRLAVLQNLPLGEPFAQALRGAAAGPLGCSHIVTLAQFVNATVAWGLQQERARQPAAARRAGERIFRRDLIFDGHQRSESGLGIGVQLADLHTAPTPALALAPAQFGSHYELRLNIALDGWPATFTQIAGAQRIRHRDAFAVATWQDLSAVLKDLCGTALEKGSAATIARVVGDIAPARDALLMLGPALIQCRAAFPDKWLNRAIETPDHPGLIAMADSCYMWRRGGALERTREALQRKGTGAGPSTAKSD